MKTSRLIRSFYFFGFNVFINLQQFILRAGDAMAIFFLSGYFRAIYESRVELFSFRWLRSDESGRWGERAVASHRLTIVVVAYMQPKALECLLASLRCQTVQNFDVIVIHDGPNVETRQVVSRYSSEEPDKYKYIETTTRYNDYGHTLRDMGITEAQGEFILITNGDNYYAPRMVEFMFEAIDAKTLDFAMWDIVHSHTCPGITRQPSYCNFSIYPIREFVDIGSFMVKTAIAKQVGFRGKLHSDDALYVEDILARPGATLRIGKVHKTLMVHN
ncbi:glycosyltransferase family 2 protein [Rhodoferax sp.]|uniref:glycosyltransferase family 2 protein n=1 Tax=Rhodoferax sp. TaxID=50421 RepID=UPI00374CC4A8